MKRFLGLLTTLMIMLNLTAFYGQAFAQERASTNTPTLKTNDPSEFCAKVLAVKSGSGEDCKIGASGAVDGENDDIIVILGESISGGSQDYSCGQIANCLREKYSGTRLSENLVTCELRKNYDQCIVSGKDGLGLLSNYASQVYNWIASIVGSLCILVIIISGIQISIGGLSQEEVSSAKDRVVRALAGLVVLFLSAFILYTINPFFFT